MKHLMSAILLAASCLTGMGQTVDTFVSELLERYPQARLLDVYKSCFQDFMGAEHMIGDTTSVRNYLQQELSTTDIEDLQPEYYEPCGINGNYVRVSLRAVKEGLISSDMLLEDFIASANSEERPSLESWAARWYAIISTIDGMELTLPHYAQDKQFIEEVLAQGKYAISHSPDYRKAYAPHYRIVRRDIFERDLLPLLPHSCCHNNPCHP